MSKVIQRIICNTISEKTECVENLKQLGYTYRNEGREEYYIYNNDFSAVSICDDNSYVLSNINRTTSDINPAVAYITWKQQVIDERGVLPYTEPTLEELLDKFNEDIYNRGYTVKVAFKSNKL